MASLETTLSEYPIKMLPAKEGQPISVMAVWIADPITVQIFTQPHVLCEVHNGFLYLVSAGWTGSYVKHAVS